MADPIAVVDRMHECSGKGDMDTLNAGDDFFRRLTPLGKIPDRLG